MTVRLVNSAEENPELYIYDPIGDDVFGGVSPKQVAEELKKIKGADRLTVRINSPGGSVFDGVAIYNLLATPRTYEVHTRVDGLAASIAALIAMAGKSITMPSNAMMMIHRAWALAAGNGDALREQAEVLDTIDNIISDVFAKRTGQTVEKARELMDAETWLTAEEALAFGFADVVSKPEQIAAYFDLARYKYKHTPECYEECRKTSPNASVMSGGEANTLISRMKMANRRHRLSRQSNGRM